MNGSIAIDLSFALVNIHYGKYEQALTKLKLASIDFPERDDIKDAINEERSDAGDPPIHYGIALHSGTVTYGNVGTKNRLQFTVWVCCNFCHNHPLF